MIYASEHYSTALIEKLVYTLHSAPAAKPAFRSNHDTRDSFEPRGDGQRTAPGWDGDDQTITRARGSAWLRSNSSALLAVPSAFTTLASLATFIHE